jgi:predicted molibdopterin-dependent oxidoreductase YjgC
MSKLPNEIIDHPVLGRLPEKPLVAITVDGRPLQARAGEPIAAQLIANGIKVFHYTPKRGEPRSTFCAIGRCTDCIMMVDGVPNVRTCVTPVREGMVIETQRGLGEWRRNVGAQPPST